MVLHRKMICEVATSGINQSRGLTNLFHSLFLGLLHCFIRNKQKSLAYSTIGINYEKKETVFQAKG